MEIDQEQELNTNPETAADGNSQQAAEETAAEEARQEEPEGQNEQSRDVRARQAEGRRIREREQRVYQQARTDEQNEMNDTLRTLRIVNPQTKKPIQNVQELKSYARALSDQRLNEGHGTAEDMRRIARETIRETRLQAEQPADSQQVSQAEIERQLAEIRSMDPEMKDLVTILNSQAGQKFREYVDKGLTFTEAYKLAAHDRLAGISGNRERARTAGKEHLAATATRGKGEVAVPTAIMAEIRKLNPDATDDEIRKFYAADQKRLKH